MHPQPEQPIGIFDSGIGGLTVARAITQLMPDENIIYFGDTAHLPYGDKSAASIRHYCERITRFLKTNNCKMVVIACNTASASGFKTVQKTFGYPELTLNVIDPVASHIVEKKERQKVGVIGTKRTIESSVYPKKIHALKPGLPVSSVATPLLAPMIEEGFFNNKISKTIINSYLSKNTLQNIDTLILACTHYPLIRKEIEQFYIHPVEIIDSATVVSQEVKRVLLRKGLLNDSGNTPNYHFYVSDYTKSFESTTRIFFQKKVKLELQSIWE